MVCWLPSALSIQASSYAHCRPHRRRARCDCSSFLVLPLPLPLPYAEHSTRVHYRHLFRTAQCSSSNRIVLLSVSDTSTSRGRGAALDNTRTDMQPDCLIEQGPVHPVRIDGERHNKHSEIGTSARSSCQNMHRRKYHPYRLAAGTPNQKRSNQKHSRQPEPKSGAGAAAAAATQFVFHFSSVPLPCLERVHSTFGPKHRKPSLAFPPLLSQLIHPSWSDFSRRCSSLRFSRCFLALAI